MQTTVRTCAWSEIRTKTFLNIHEEETQKQAKDTYVLLCINVQNFFNMETFPWSEDILGIRSVRVPVKLDTHPVQTFLTMDTFSRV